MIVLCSALLLFSSRDVPIQVGVTVLTLAVRDDGGAVDAQAADGIIRSHAYTVVGQCQVPLRAPTVPTCNVILGTMHSIVSLQAV